MPILNGALSNNHPLIELPPEYLWDDTNHLEISLALIGDKVEDVEYPKYCITPPEKDTIERLYPLRIDDKRNLLITFTLCPDKLENSFQWHVRRKK